MGPRSFWVVIAVKRNLQEWQCQKHWWRHCWKLKIYVYCILLYSQIVDAWSKSAIMEGNLTGRNRQCLLFYITSVNKGWSLVCYLFLKWFCLMYLRWLLLPPKCPFTNIGYTQSLVLLKLCALPSVMLMILSKEKK